MGSTFPLDSATADDHYRATGELLLSPFPTRRKFLQFGAAGVALGALGTAGDGTIFEANRPRLVSIEVALARLPESWDGFRIAQLSDFHYDDFFSVVPLRKAIDIVNRLRPDLIVLTGDFVTSPVRRSHSRRASGAASAIEPCAQWLTQLRARLGILAVLGNHDVGTDGGHITAVLQSQGISVLTNRSVPLEHEGSRLWVSGVDDILEGRPNLDLALSGIPAAEPVILLAHEPDWADFVAHHSVDLQLSGHSHGGQIRLPLIGPPYLPKLARKYPWGLRQHWSTGPLHQCRSRHGPDSDASQLPSRGHSGYASSVPRGATPRLARRRGQSSGSLPTDLLVAWVVSGLGSPSCFSTLKCLAALGATDPKPRFGCLGVTGWLRAHPLLLDCRAYPDGESHIRPTYPVPSIVACRTASAS